MKAVHSGPFPQGPPRPTVPRVANEAMPPKEHSMIKHALFARLEARPGKEEQVAAGLQEGGDLLFLSGPRLETCEQGVLDHGVLLRWHRLVGDAGNCRPRRTLGERARMDCFHSDPAKPWTS